MLLRVRASLAVVLAALLVGTGASTSLAESTHGPDTLGAPPVSTSAGGSPELSPEACVQRSPAIDPSVEPSPDPSASPSAAPSLSASTTPSIDVSSSPSPSPSPSAEASSPTGLPSSTPTDSVTPTSSPESTSAPTSEPSSSSGLRDLPADEVKEPDAPADPAPEPAPSDTGTAAPTYPEPTLSPPAAPSTPSAAPSTSSSSAVAEPSTSPSVDEADAEAVVFCPPTVTGIEAVPGDSAVTLTWQDAQATLAADIDVALGGDLTAEVDTSAVLMELQVRVTAIEGAADSTTITVDPAATEATVTGLRNGRQYSASIRGLGAHGSGEWSAAVEFTPTTGVEGVIGGVLVKADGEAPLAGAVPSADKVTSVALAEDGEVVDGITKVALSESVDVSEATAISETLTADAGISWAEPDLVLLPASVSAADMSPDQAWNIAGDYGVGEVTDPQAGAGVTIAVIDTGVTGHPGLRDRLVPGYDFVTDPDVLAATRSEGADPVPFDGDYAGDFGGAGRDADPRDPGDWRGVTPVRDSTWHGTHTAGVIAAAVPGARIQPIRALSWRGGLLSDVAAGITWASGGAVDGAPANATPSQVINLSFSVQAACPKTLQAAIDGAVARGSAIVAAAGNAGDDASAYAPGNCAGVITVGATGRDGLRAAYSNYGDVIDVSAPGGAVHADGGVVAASSTGTTLPGAPTTAAREGTSIAAAHTSAALAVIAAARPDAGPQEWTKTLTGSHLRSFPGDSCDADTSKTCGAGLVQISTSTLPPFTCQPVLYQSAQVGSKYLFRYTLNGTNGFTFERVGDANGGLNGMGYNTRDNYIYGNIGGSLVRLGSNGSTEVVDNAAGLGHNTGDFWGPDILISGDGTSNNWKKVDLTDSDNPVITDFTLDNRESGVTYRGSDIAILGNTAYAVHDSGTGLFVIDLTTRKIRMVSLTGLSGEAGGFGAAFADSLGNLFFHHNGGYVWRILATDLAKNPVPISKVGEIPKYGTSTLSAPNDGASCAAAASPYSATINAEASSSITASTASVTADVDPQDLSTTAVMCYGTSSATSGGRLLGCTDSSQPANASTASPLTGSTATSLTPVTLTGLAARTTYYWQVVTTSAYATTYGDVQNFTTTGAPTAVTQPTSSVATTTAVLNGVVNPGGRATSVDFCFGTASDLTGCTTQAATPASVAGTSSDTSVSATLTGLSAGTRYYARVSATNDDGTTTGSIVSFTTPAPPQVTLQSTSAVTSSDARLNATVNPQGRTTSVTFCYGTSSSLSGCTTASAAESPLVAVSADVDVTADITGLTAATTYYVRATATNENGTTTSSTTSFTTSARPLVLTTTTGALTTGTVGAAYSKTLAADGGVAPYTWSVSSGSLPAGLALNSSSGAITGTPTADGTSTFTAEVTDATSQTATRSFTIITVAAPVATTAAATSVGTTTAVLNGTVDPGNLLTTAQFCFGTSVNLAGCSTVAADESPLAAATSAASVSATLAGLSPGTTYYARAQAANSAGSDTGAIVSFTTASAPSATTGEATFRDKTSGAAILNATVDDNGLATTVSFCYGSTPTLTGATCTSVTPALAAGSGSMPVSLDVSGLTLGAVYYFNVTAANSGGTTAGATVEFTMPLSTAPTPTITSVSPTTGDASGGTSITITGTNFSTTGTGATVTIGSTPATSVTVNSSTSITATVPAGSAGAVDVIVHNLDGQAVRKVNAFTYTSSTFTVTYDANGATSGSAPTDGTAYTYGESATVLGKGALARSGYDFTGWNTAANGSGTDYLALTPLRVTATTTLYAQWEGVPLLGVSATSVDFGSQNLADGPTASRTVTVTNTGGADLTIDAGGISVTGSAASDFSVTSGTCSAGGTVVAGSSCTVEAAFDPSSAGSHGVVLNVATSAGTVSVSLSGVGVDPSASPTPTPTPTSGSGSGSGGSTDTAPPAPPATRTPPPLTRAPVGVVLGGGFVLVDGQLIPVRPEPAPTGGAWTVTGPDFALQFTPQSDGAGGLTGPAEVLTSPAGDWVQVDGDGYLGGSMVSAYLVPATSARVALRTLSEPVYLGEVPVETDGSFDVRLTIPDWATPGSYSIQVNGWSPQEAVRSVTIALDVTDPASRMATRTVRKAAFFKSASDDLSRNGRRKLRTLVSGLPAAREDVTVWITAVSTPMTTLEEDLRLAARRGDRLRDFLTERGVRGSFFVSVTTKEDLRNADKAPIVYSKKGKPLTTVQIEYTAPVE